MELINAARQTTLRFDGRSAGASYVSSGPRYGTGAVIAGRYVVDSLIGSGGMGAVYRGHEVETRTPVAIKLAIASSDQHEVAMRMQAEAEIEAELQHPGIVRSLDYGRTAHGDAFIVMELLEGESLREILVTRGRLSPNEAVRLLLPIAEALSFVHSCSIVHRDIKPENIFVAATEHGSCPKILDFGIAKRRSATSWTCDGALVGSPGYMAPEQARAQVDVDERVDIWAFCLVLYEAVAGAAALPLPEVATVLPHEAYALDVQPTLQAMGGCEPLFRIVQRGLAHDREHRFGTMREVSQALTSWLRAQPRARRFVSYPMVA